MASIIVKSTSLPVLHACDAVVVGGSFAGLAAALALAQAGRAVALVEPRTYLGREVTACLRPWITLPALGQKDPLPEPVAACLQASGARRAGDEYPLHMGAVKRQLEDLLLAAGIRLLYASLPVAVLGGPQGVQGIVIGNKSGRQVIACQAAIDATETALLARLAGARFAPEEQAPARFRSTLEFDRIGPLQGSEVALPQRLGVSGNRAVLHAGWRGPQHVLVECELELARDSSSALAMTRREMAARRTMAGVAEHLLGRVKAFRGAYLGGASHELWGPATPPLADDLPTWAERLGGPLPLPSDGEPPPLSALAGPLRGLWCLNEAARLPGGLRQELREALPASLIGASLGSLLGERWADVSGRCEAPEGAPYREGEPCSGLQVREPAAPQRGRPSQRRPVGAAAIPVLGQVDVLVVGGGTSGAAAAITAAREGVRTAVVDMNPGLGGTGTYGGVHSYWFGQRTGAVARIMGLVDRMHQRLGLPTQAGQIPSWNIEAKGWALLQEAEEAGAEVLLNALAWGTVVEDAVVRGAVVATRTGPVALLARVLIDATGDADLAAFAGAECVYGAERDHVTMWYSLPQFREPGITRNNFASMVDVGNIEDYTRAILAGRRRGAATDHDHGVYVAPRESRHLHAEAVVTLTDQLLRRAWPDVVYIAYSNSDIKGHSTSDWVRMGLISPNLEVEVPYRALLPRGLDNLIVAGKAFGATHDALPAMRMQPDLENLGAVAALAAVEAVRSGAPPRYTAAARLQQRLVAEGLLPARVLRRTLRPMRLSDAELARQIASLSAARPLSAYSDMEIGEVYRGRIPFVDVLCAGPRAVPMLEEALRPARGRRRVLLAQGLAALGSRAGVPVLIEAIERELASGRLPERRTEIRHANEPPDQGAMPEAAYLLYSLGMARDRRALPVWQRVVDLLAHVTADDLHDRAAATLAERSASRKGIFYYVDSVCFGAERLGDPEAIPILSRLHSYPLFHGQVLTSGFQAEVLHERLAYLELAIGRALGRSGSPEGLLILIDYLADVRALLAEHAHSELVAISACDHGKDLAAWGQWLEAVGDSLKPSPIAAPTDPVRAWTESVLLERRGFERTPRPGCRLHGT